SLAHRLAGPPGTLGNSSGCRAMWRLAGNTATIVAISDHPADRRDAFGMSPAPPASSATPLAYTSAVGAGRYGGTIRRYARGMTKCMAPARRKNGPAARR